MIDSLGVRRVLPPPTDGAAAEEGTSRAVKAGSPVSRERWKTWAAVAVYLVLCLLVQWQRHAGDAAFGSYPDEPAHYVGGLLIHDYLAAGHLQSPMVFSRAYYDRLPYFAIGYWPPLFYFMEGAWMLLFGPSRPIVLLLMAVFGAGTAWLIMQAIRREAGFLAGFCGGLLFLALPEVQRQLCTVMVDLPVTFLALSATVFAARYLASGKWSDSVGFAVLAGAACLTKYSAGYVCLVPFLGIVVLKRWPLLRSRTFWAQPAIVVAMIAPWAIFTANLVTTGLPHARSGALLLRFGRFLRALLWVVPWPVWLLIAAGMAVWAFWPVRWRETEVSFTLHAIVLIAFLTASSVSAEPRYLIPGAGALLVASLSGVRWMRSRMDARLLSAVLLVPVALTLGLTARMDPHLRENTFRAAVDRVLSEPRWNNAAILVAGEAEGPMIAEFAMRDPHRPGYRLIRPGKVLSKDDWFGGNYQSLVQNPGDIDLVLDSLHVKAVILSPKQNVHARLHDVLLREAVVDRPGLWRPVRVDGPAGESPYEVFEAVGHAF